MLSHRDFWIQVGKNLVEIRKLCHHLTKLVNVGVEDLGSEQDLGGHHGVLIREEELSVEETALVGGLAGAGDLHEEVARVVLAGLSIDANN